MVEHTRVSRKTTNEDRISICPQLGCETIKRVKPLRLGFIGFGKYPHCKLHHLPLMYVDERIGEVVDAALSCLFDKAGLPPQELLNLIKVKFPKEFSSFIKNWVYCITIGRGASNIFSYMDSLSNSYLKQITKKQIRALKEVKNIDHGRKRSKVIDSIRKGIDEITLQYTRLLKHLRAHSEVLIDVKKLSRPSKELRLVLEAWLEVSSKEAEKSFEIKEEQDIPLSQVKKYYDKIINLGTCRCLLGLPPIRRNNKEEIVLAFDRFSAYLEFWKEHLTNKFTKSDINDLKNLKNAEPYSVLTVFKYTIEDMHKLAKRRGGEFLSIEFKGVNKAHRWKCNDCGNIWNTRPANIMGIPSKPEGSWCPKCSSGIGERMTRKFFEIIFNAKFPEERRLKWLSDKRMQIDGYNDGLKIAFERHGIQHYRFTPVFHKILDDFKKQQNRDEYIRTMCKKEGILLFEIGWEKRNSRWVKITYNEMEQYIRDMCKEKGILPPLKKEKIDWRDFDVAHPKYLKKYKKIAKQRDGTLKSPKYLGAKELLLWHCNKHDYDWWAMPSDIKDKPNRKGNWCPICGEETRSSAQLEHTIEDMKKLAVSRGEMGSKFISSEFKGMHKPHEWQCALGHIWSAVPSAIQGTTNQKGSWCPVCYDKYGRISKIQVDIIETLRRGGKFIFEIADQLVYNRDQIKKSLRGLEQNKLVYKSMENCPNSPKYSRQRLLRFFLKEEAKLFLENKENGLYNFLPL